MESPLEKLRLQVSGQGSPILKGLDRLSPASLAYLGDAVYELYIRTYYLLPPQRLGDYHAQVVGKVRAEQQALDLAQLQPLS